MQETILATYTRQSTLWKNANAFYKMQDYTKLICAFWDYSEERDDETIRCYRDGEDVTEEVMRDRYVIVLKADNFGHSKTFSFSTRQEANEGFLAIINDKHINGWRKA